MSGRMVVRAPRARRARTLHAREHGPTARQAGLKSKGAGSAHERSRSATTGSTRSSRSRRRWRWTSHPHPTRSTRGARREGRAWLLRLELSDVQGQASLDRQRSGGLVSTTALDIAAVRARFSALDRRLAFFDGRVAHSAPMRSSMRSRGICARTTRTSARPTRRAGGRPRSSTPRTSAPRRSSAARRTRRRSGRA